MIGFLYLISFLICFHAGMMVHGLYRNLGFKNEWYSLTAGSVMIVFAVMATIFQSWPILIISYGVYRILLLVEAFRSSGPRPTNFWLLSITGFLVVVATLSLLMQQWWIFVIGYCCRWCLTYLVVNRQIMRKYPSE